MSKQRSKITCRISPYCTPRIAWRRAIHAIVSQACKDNKVTYRPADELELHILLYLEDAKLAIHDVDNRLKDIMDALQGRAGGSKARSSLPPIIPNDRQIYKVVIEKQPPTKQSRGLGHLIIKKRK